MKAVICRKQERGMPGGMVDMHSHILPGVDDGAQTSQEAMEMLRIAAASGIREIILTPHYKEGRHNASVRTLSERLERMRKKVMEESIPISLHLGNEILYFDGLEEELEKGRALTLAGSRYVLLEFYPEESFHYIRNALDKIRGNGYEPILAHAERYVCMWKRWENVRELKDMHIGIQINAEGIVGRPGSPIRRFTRRLLTEQLADYIGTDAHGCKGRTPDVSRCLKYLYRRYDLAYVEAICRENAGKILKEAAGRSVLGWGMKG